MIPDMHFYAQKRAVTTVERPWPIPALCAAYGWPHGMTCRGTIAIIEMGGGWHQSDVDQAFAAMKLHAPSITDVSVNGVTNTPGNDADGEVALDIQVAAAAYTIATGQPAKIRIYWTNDIAAGVRKAAADGCRVCSISWGADEADWGTAAAHDMEAAALEACNADMAVFAASGDNDSSDGGSTPANVDLPASCPHVVACGGTKKPESGAETVWNDNPGQTNGEGTGGGYSTIFPPQTWQIGAPQLKGGHPGRLVPDVAACADPNTGYEIVLNGQVLAFGGTSAVAPLYAGLFAAINAKSGFIGSTLWKNRECFNDITVGDNGMYHAQVGPDPCTGLGSLKAGSLFRVFHPPVA